MTDQQILEEFKEQVQEAIKNGGEATFIDLFSLASMPPPFATHVLELIKAGRIKLVVPGPSEIQ
jgi:hypothetical protein